jgi:hypothetical protein
VTDERGGRPAIAAVAVVLVVLATQVALHHWWLARDDGIQDTDAAFHLAQVAQWGQALAEGPSAWLRMREGDEQQRYGTLWYAVAGTVAAIVGAWPPALLRALTTLLWPALAWAGWRLGAAFAVPARRPLTAAATSVVLMGLPGLVHYGRVVVLDVPLTLFVTLAVAAFWEARAAGLPARKVVVAAAFTLAAVGIKANALLFLLGPAAVALQPWWAEPRDRRRLLAVLVLGAVVAAALVLGPRGAALRETLRDATWPGKALGYWEEGTLQQLPGDWLTFVREHSWEVLTFTVMQTLSPPVALLGLTGLTWVFARRHWCKDPQGHWQRLALFLWLVPSSLAFLFLLRGLYDERYVLPLLPVVALGIAATIADLPGRAFRIGALVLVMVGLLVTNFVTTAGALADRRPFLCTTVPGWGQGVRVAKDLWLCALYPRYHFLDRPTTPRHEEWPIDALEGRLLPQRARVGRPLRALFLDDLYGLFYRIHQRELLRATNRPPLDRVLDEGRLTYFAPCQDEARVAETFGGGTGFQDILDEADVVVLRWGSARGEQVLHGRRCRAFMDRAGSFVSVAEVPMADGSAVRVFGRWGRAGE